MVTTYFERLSHLPVGQQLNHLISGGWVAQAVGVAAELGIADRLADGPRSSDDLAQATGAHPRALYRLLRALASVGIFTEVEPRQNIAPSMGRRASCSRASSQPTLPGASSKASRPDSLIHGVTTVTAAIDPVEQHGSATVRRARRGRMV